MAKKATKKKFIVYMVFAPKAPKKFLRNPFFTMDIDKAIAHRNMMVKNGWHTVMHRLSTEDVITYCAGPPKKNKGFARVDFIAAGAFVV